MSFLCDTNIVSEIMRPQPNLNVQAWLTGQELIFLSVVTVEEIYFGLAAKNASRQIAWFEKFLALRTEVLPVTLSITRRCGLWRGEFRRHGITRIQADMLIAATAEINQLTLVTRNIRDFEGCGLTLLNPFE